VPIEQPLGEIYSLFTAVEAAGQVQHVVRTLDVRADGVVAARLGLEESTPAHLERCGRPTPSRWPSTAWLRAVGGAAARRRFRPHRSTPGTPTSAGCG
jgi:hypothetical protein